MTLILAVLANRASACSRPLGMRSAAERVISRRRTSSTRSNARTNSGALLRYGPLRRRSSSDWCPLSGIDRRVSSLDRVSGDAAAASIDQTRSSTRARSRATCRSKVVTAGNRTFCAISQVVARSNRTPGRSVPVQQSAYNQRLRRNWAPGSPKSRKPQCRRISAAWSQRVSLSR